MHVPFPLQCWDVMAKLRDKNNIAKGSGETKGRKIVQSSSAHVEERDQELWGTLEQDCLWLVSTKKKPTIKVFLIGPFKFARERLNVRRVWRVSGFFPRNVEVNTTGRFLISSIPEQHLHDQLGRITGFSNFQIK